MKDTNWGRAEYIYVKYDRTTPVNLRHPVKFLTSCLLLTLSTLGNICYGQTEQVKDTANVAQTASLVDSVRQDSLERHTEISPLDIGRNRGLFILSSDKLMQMRILGSVRALFNLDNRELEEHNAFNPFELPTDDRIPIENFYAGLSQTRLGFEVTRRTRKIGDIFLRIEADFLGQSGAFRIRHAYGQVKNFIVGQTWSLFSNVQFLPPTVDVNGPVGSSGLRTPQIRYYRTINERMSWYLGIEYSTPRLNAPDSINTELLQVIPDFAGKIDYKQENLSLQLALLVATLSGRNTAVANSDVQFKVGFGGTFAAKFRAGKVGTFYSSVIAGEAIAHYLDIYGGKGMDAVFNPEQLRFETLRVYSTYVAYSRDLPANLSLNAAFGISAIGEKDFVPDDYYQSSYNAIGNIFWQPVDGARLGVEFVHGRRVDADGSKGYGFRVASLIYYDF